MQGANHNEIKTAYLSLAKKHHPDKNGNKEKHISIYHVKYNNDEGRIKC